MPSAPARSCRLVVCDRRSVRAVGAHRPRDMSCAADAIPAAQVRPRADEAARTPASAARVRTRTTASRRALLGDLARGGPPFCVRGAPRRVSMSGSVLDDTESRRSVRRRSPRRSCRGDGDGGREPVLRACRSWPTTRQPRWAGWCRLVRSFLAAIPIGSLTTSIPHRRLHEGSSVGFAIEFAQNKALS